MSEGKDVLDNFGDGRISRKEWIEVFQKAIKLLPEEPYEVCYTDEFEICFVIRNTVYYTDLGEWIGQKEIRQYDDAIAEAGYDYVVGYIVKYMDGLSGRKYYKTLNLENIYNNVEDKESSSEVGPLSKAKLNKIWGMAKLPDGSYKVTAYNGNELEVVVPAKIGNSSISAIGEKAFCAFSSKKEKINETRMKITKVVIEEGICEIGSEAFSCCTSLTEVILPSTIKTIGEGAFDNTRIKELVLPVGIESIGKDGLASFPAPGVQLGVKTAIVMPGSYAQKYCEETGVPYKLS